MVVYIPALTGFRVQMANQSTDGSVYPSFNRLEEIYFRHLNMENGNLVYK